MKTIIIEKIDGYEIIKAFDEALIDPVATQKKVMELHNKTDEAKAVEKKAEELRRLYTNRLEAVRAAKEAFKKGDQNEHAKHYYLVELRDEQIKDIEDEMIDLLKNKKEKDIQLWKDNRVYFEPKPGEIIISDSEYEKLGSAFMAHEKNGNKTDINGNEILDNRGLKYVKAGKILIVEKLGEKPGGKLLSEYKPEELEQERYNYMSLEDIETEKQNKINYVAAQAANIRSVLEIQKDDKALEKAQEWYNNEVEKVELTYLEILEKRPK